jgi:hypothetical protein
MKGYERYERHERYERYERSVSPVLWSTCAYLMLETISSGEDGRVREICTFDCVIDPATGVF